MIFCLLADLLERPVSPEMVIFYLTQDTQRHPLLPELKSGLLLSFACLRKKKVPYRNYVFHLTSNFFLEDVECVMTWSTYDWYCWNRWIPGYWENVHSMLFIRSHCWWTNSRSVCSSDLFDWHALASCRVNPSWGENSNWTVSDSDYTGMHPFSSH